MLNKRFDLDNVYNFREIGGYTGLGGKKVRKGIFFRSDDLSTASDSDIEIISTIPILTNVDFRYDQEIKRAPNRIPSSLKNNHELSIEVGSLIDLMKESNSYERMEEINRILVRDFQHVYRKFFEILMDSENLPLMFHCSAGKDRTGFAAAMILSALGVDRKTILQDYMLSKIYIEPKYKDVVSYDEELYPYYTVKESYLLAAFDSIDNDYSGIEEYLKNQLKVDLVEFQNRYLD